MNFLCYTSRTIIMVISILLTSFESQAMVIAASCLKRCIRPNKNTKLLLLSHRHAFDFHDVVKKDHIQDMEKLLTITANSKHSVPFLIEFSDAHKDSVRLNNMINTAENIAIKKAINNHMKYGAITFIPFDNRTLADTWIRDMMYQKDQFIKAIREGFNFPSDFYTVTGELFFNLLDNRYDSNIDSIERLPITKNIQDHYLAVNKQKHTECYDHLSRLLKAHNINPQNHLFNLIAQLNNAETTELFMSMVEENCFAVDINLLQKSLTLSEKNPLCILSAGVYHSHNMEKQLLSHFSGFEKDISSSMSLPDLKINNLSDIHYPTQVPDHFMNKNMEAFITNYANANE